MEYIFEIVPESHPHVIRNCAKCATKKPFAPSDQIRINAQKKVLDVWLIYRCQHCGNTWNMEVFERISPKQLAGSVYEQLLSNDASLIQQLAFDPTLHSRAGTQLCYEGMQYAIHGDSTAACGETEPYELVLRCAVPLGVRVSKLVREILCLSSKLFEQMVVDGRISPNGDTNIAKARMGTECRITIRPSRQG